MELDVTSLFQVWDEGLPEDHLNGDLEVGVGPPKNIISQIHQNTAFHHYFLLKGEDIVEILLRKWNQTSRLSSRP